MLLLWVTVVNKKMVVKLQGQTSSRKRNETLEIHLSAAEYLCTTAEDFYERFEVLMRATFF